jgi:CRISPR-associated exonuclease Cas4
MTPVLISAIEHYSYCPRQCALIHLESVFDENLFTLRGHAMHERVHEEGARTERGRKVLRGLPIWSDEHGLLGKSDAVEIEGDRAVPVEYKVGRDVGSEHALLQAVAQALCLREMLGLKVEEVAIFYGATKTRASHAITPELERRVLEIVAAIRVMTDAETMPPPVADRRCRKCSLIDACQPFAVASAQKVAPAGLFQPRPEARGLP